MKNLKTFALIIASFTMLNLNATVHTVDNNPGSAADFGTLAAAISAASAYDTIYITGSPYNYDGTATIRINKAGLVLIGPGYFLGANSKTQANNNTAKIYELEIGQGADNVVVMGLDFHSSGRVLYISDNLSDGSDGSVGPSNVIIRRNKIDQLYLGRASSDNTISGTIVEQNFFNTYYNCVYIYTANVANTVFQYNIFNTTSTSYSAIYSVPNTSLSNTVIRNNVLTSDIERIHSIEIYNNVFSTSATIYNSNNNNVYNNVFTEATVYTGTSTGNNDFSNLSGQSLVGLFATDSPVYDKDYQLGATSPALGAGVDAVDAGAFGGSGYKLSGLPPVPSIYQVFTNGYGNANDGMNVTISVKSNQ